MTLTAADYARVEPSYAWRCASCARLFATNRPPDPPLLSGPVTYARNPISADETKEHALQCCAVYANDRPDLHAGFWSRPAPGADAYVVRDVERAPLLRRRIERRPLELALVFVERGDSQVWTAPKSERRIPDGFAGVGIIANDMTARIVGYRLDVFIDEDRENRRDYFTTLLAGLRLQPCAGEQDQGPRDGYTLEKRPHIATDVYGGEVRLATHLDDDGPHMNEDDESRAIAEEDVMFHAGVTPGEGLYVQARQHFNVRLNYGLAPGLNGQPSPIPIGFMRVVVLGELTRDEG